MFVRITERGGRQQSAIGRADEMAWLGIFAVGRSPEAERACAFGIPTQLEEQAGVGDPINASVRYEAEIALVNEEKFL
ncbi:hypothetical protein D3C73_1410390 [compost metagenome]